MKDMECNISSQHQNNNNNQQHEIENIRSSSAPKTSNRRKLFILFSSFALVSCIIAVLSLLEKNDKTLPLSKRNLQTTNNQYFWYLNSAVTKFSSLTLYDDDIIDTDDNVFNNDGNEEQKVPKSIKVIEKTNYQFQKPKIIYELPPMLTKETDEPTPSPTLKPTSNPTPPPTPSPTLNPTSNPTSPPTSSPTNPIIQKFTFYVMGDIPYSDDEKEQLKIQLTDLPYDGDFIVHVGDVHKTKRTKCAKSAYSDVRDILLDYSSIPVFVLPGDNDWKDCPKPYRALNTWFENFEAFEQNWSPLPFEVNRESKTYLIDDDDDDKIERYQSEYFSFVHKNILFIGVHILGGSIFDQREWELRHKEQLEWTINNIGYYTNDKLHGIVIFGHAGPGKNLKNDDYFDPLVQIHDDYISSIPIVYIHGNGHRYRYYQPFNSNTMTALQVDQGAIASPLRITFDPTVSINQYSRYSRPNQGFMNFEFDRRL